VHTSSSRARVNAVASGQPGNEDGEKEKATYGSSGIVRRIGKKQSKSLVLSDEKGLVVRASSSPDELAVVVARERRMLNRCPERSVNQPDSVEESEM
jgi:RNase H-fold protein (predicted Holliday junction resolvase)